MAESLTGPKFGHPAFNCNICSSFTQRNRSSFILRITYPQSSVTPPLAGPSGRRPPGMWRSPEPSPGSGGRPGLRATHAACRRWWQPPKASLDHPGDVHFGLLKPISFIPWLWNGQVWPKGPYPNLTKPNQIKEPHNHAWTIHRNPVNGMMLILGFYG